MSKLQSARGTHDLFGADVYKHLTVTEQLNLTAKLFGYTPIATPIFEFFEVFHRTLGETSDVVSKETYTFEDRGGEKITLRPEGTAGVVRSLIEHGRLRELPVRHFYNGPMFRYERPQKGRQRQFHQVGFELFGVENHFGDVELIHVAWSFLKSLKLQGDVVLEINSIGDQDSRKAYRDELVKYLQAHTSQLSEDSQKRLVTNPLRILDSKEKTDQDLLKNAPQFDSYLNQESKDFFNGVQEGLKALGIPFVINPRLVRGLDYYRHCVFEIKSSALGAQDTILGGGRYDGLIPMMGGPATPAVGWAAGIERLALLMPVVPESTIDAFVFGMDQSTELHALSIAAELRDAGISVEVPYSGNMGKKLKKADKAQAKVAIIIGADEFAKGEVMVKDLRANQQTSIPVKSLIKHIQPLLVK
jgi:histidyl-tRNA synthetase